MLPMFLFQPCCKNYRYRCYNLSLKYTPLSIFFYLHFPRYYQKLFQHRPSPPRSSLQKDATYLKIHSFYCEEFKIFLFAVYDNQSTIEDKIS
jgi:hypothetical protein